MRKVLICFLLLPVLALLFAGCENDEDNIRVLNYDLETILPYEAGSVYTYKQVHTAGSDVIYEEEIKITYIENLDYMGRHAIKYSTQKREWDNPEAEWSEPYFEYLSISSDSLFICTNTTWAADALFCELPYSLPGDTLSNSVVGFSIFESDTSSIQTPFNSYYDCIYLKFLGANDEYHSHPNYYHYYKPEYGLVYLLTVDASVGIVAVTTKYLMSIYRPEE